MTARMGVVATPHPGEKPLKIRPVLRDTTRLYRTLFRRSFLTGFVVFAILGLSDFIWPAVAGNTTAAVITTIVILAALFVGTTLVQGALVQVVDSEHRGAPVTRIADLYRRSWSRLGPLVAVSVLSGIGVGLGMLLLFIPGVLLAIRWALAPPIVMLEGLGPRAAMSRSRDLVRGHRWAVFRVLVNVWGRVAVAWFVLAAVLGHLGANENHRVALWLGAAFASALVTPYAGHALSVMYYRLTDPQQPVLPEPELDADGRWESIWRDHAETET
jgi:hypothetical protein